MKVVVCGGGGIITINNKQNNRESYFSSRSRRAVRHGPQSAIARARNHYQSHRRVRENNGTKRKQSVQWCHLEG